MKLAIQQLKVYVRAALVVVAVVAVGLFLFKNRTHTVSVWFFGVTDPTRPINVVWLITFTAVGSLVMRWVLVMGWRLWRSLSELKRLRALEGASKILDDRAVELEERERRIDEKVQRAITEDE